MKCKIIFSNHLLLTLVLLVTFLQTYSQPQASISPATINKALDEAYNKFKDLKEGKNADYIKELATVDPNIFGVVLVTTDGKIYTKGDISSMVSIQSVSKVFTMARVIEEQGAQAVDE